MSEVQGESFVFGKRAAVDPDLPNLTADLSRSYQWPFHLRMHRHKWEFVGDKWRPIVERVHLRPGVGGVGGKPGNIDTMNDLAMLQQWSKAEDGQWLIIPSGDPRIHGTCNADGNFLRRVNVQHNGRTGSVLIGFWERVTQLGTIVTDEDVLTTFALQVMDKIGGIKEPTPRAIADAAKKTRILLAQLQASASGARTPGGSPQLRKRIERVAGLLSRMTGEPVEGVAVEEPRQPRKIKTTRRADPLEALRAALADLSPEQRAALLAPDPKVTP